MARPRKIEKDDALEAAMQAFWAKGYEATSMQDLMDATGLKKGSLYQSFGDKKQLFMDALQRYADRNYHKFKDYMRDAASPGAALEGFLTEEFVGFALENTTRQGCFVVNSTVELGPHDDDVRALVHRQNERMEALFTETLQKAQDEGAIRKDIPAEDLAVEMNVMLYGLMADSKSSGDAERTRKLAANFFRSLSP